MTPLLEWVLVVFIIVLMIVIVVVSVYLVKFIQETTLTMTNLKEISELAKKELEPAMKSINGILATVNNISSATNKQFELIKKVITTLIGASCIAFGRAKNNSGFFSGLFSGFNIFKRKRR